MQVSDIIDGEHLVRILRRSLACVDSEIIDHGERVAFILHCMMQCEGGHSRKELDDVCMLSFLHDIGAFKNSVNRTLQEIEQEDMWEHATYGYVFLKDFSPLLDLSDAVLMHHVDYQSRKRYPVRNCALSNRLYLADQIDTMRMHGAEVTAALEDNAGEKFSPQDVALFLKADAQFKILEKLNSGEYAREMAVLFMRLNFTSDELECYLRMIIFLIDFRSEFTVAHTILTVYLSDTIAEVMGADPRLIRDIHVGAMLHDIGKISTPVDILESPGKLSDNDMIVMQNHVSMSEWILRGCLNQKIVNIAVRHHEKLNGTGYPRGISGNEISTPERIVAIADIVCALKSKRSYKEGFPPEKVLAILRTMANNGGLDKKIVELVCERYDEINAAADAKARPILDSYQILFDEYQDLKQQMLQS